MKDNFGNLLTRLLDGGTTLTRIEKVIIERLIETLPPILASILLAQLDACNVVQREIDGRALNFYRKSNGVISREGIPDLPIKQGEVPLLKIAFSISGAHDLVHATMTAVNRQFFCVNFSHDLRPFSRSCDLKVEKVTESWRSSIARVVPVS
jgi:hypothetical protein